MKLHLVILILYISFLGLTCSNNPKTVIIQEIELPETREFINFWKDFSIKFNSMDTGAIRKVTLDTIWLWGDRVPSIDFIERYFSNYSSTDFSRIILDTTKTSYSSIGCHPSPPVDGAIKLEYSDAFNCQEVTIKDTIGTTVDVLEFTFLKTTNAYKLFGIKRYDYSLSQVDPMIDTTKSQH